uniref:Uncharacterized protein n=1 Tax=Pithovirus LCPAC304 TaxID=2506594 RepID=A0A481Z7M5_9VIRU|nr:MAG: hypothetical protein LCPAC304_01150 [Pithovirus LCPAC304]
MSSLGFWTTEEVPLAKKAQNAMHVFEERKARYMKKWVVQGIAFARTEILLEALLGEDHLNFYLEEHLYNLDPLIARLDSKEKTYELTGPDKDYLMSEIKNHYADEEQYPELACSIQKGHTNGLFFGWGE